MQGGKVILLLDNYDSFTYNLFQYLGELGRKVEVRRNDAITVEEVRRANPEAVVISPGPRYPNQAGISVDLIGRCHESFPILGVCLGHQAICEAFGGKIVKVPEIFHGKSSFLRHDAEEIFEGLSNPLEVGRYHSLMVDPDTLPACLRCTSRTEDGVVMSVSHVRFPVFGIQFHPESVLTPEGKSLLENFLRLAEERKRKRNESGEGRRSEPSPRRP